MRNPFRSPEIFGEGAILYHSLKKNENAKSEHYFYYDLFHCVQSLFKSAPIWILLLSIVMCLNLFPRLGFSSFSSYTFFPFFIRIGK